MTMNQPMARTSPAALWLCIRVGTIKTTVAAMMLTTWIAPKTRERSWYLAAITEAQLACDRPITEVPM